MHLQVVNGQPSVWRARSPGLESSFSVLRGWLSVCRGNTDDENNEENNGLEEMHFENQICEKNSFPDGIIYL